MSPKPRPSPPPPTSPRWLPLLLFALALTLRLLFWQATPDADWPHSAYYKGDALTWADQARAAAAGEPYELDLPLRPPGAALLLSALWDGQSPIGRGQALFLWCLLGAAAAPLVYSAVRRSFGDRVALISGLLVAGSNGLMVFSTSLNNETPYLFLVLLAFTLWPGLRRQPTRLDLAAWGALNALACLVRVEHVLVCLLATAWLGWEWGWPSARRRLVPGVVAFVLVLLPWQLRAGWAVHRFNTVEPSLDPAAAAAQAQVEQALAGVEWTPAALAERDRLPAFCRRTASNFVAATLAYRRQWRVEGADFAVLEEAFGSRPEPVSRLFFVSLYGGLNFYLAHHPQAEVGFSRAALDRPPPLAGGSARYPPWLTAGLPPPDLALVYPPHLEALNHGWRLGLEAIRARPGLALRRAGARLVPFWEGAALGFGGDNLPLGGSGIRRRADLVVPEAGLGSRVWQLGWLAVAAAGLWVGGSAGSGSRAGLVPWLALLATKMVASAAFFGYARHGATAIPALALLVALALDRWLPSWGSGRSGIRGCVRIALVIALVAITVESYRWVREPALSLDSRRVSAVDPWPGEIHEARRLGVD